MPSARRRGTETSETRAVLLDITERVMLADGYAAVSSRRIAKEAGVTPPLIHYYFGTLDELFLAVFRRRAERQLERHEQVLNSPQPLQALWAFLTERHGAAWMAEFMALANHRKVIAREVAVTAERFRRVQLDALSDRLEKYGLDAAGGSPVAVLVLINSLSRTVMQEEAIGMQVGLSETRDLVEKYLEHLEGPPAPEPGARTRAQRPKGR